MNHQRLALQALDAEEAGEWRLAALLWREAAEELPRCIEGQRVQFHYLRRADRARKIADGKDAKIATPTAPR